MKRKRLNQILAIFVGFLLVGAVIGVRQVVAEDTQPSAEKVQTNSAPATSGPVLVNQGTRIAVGQPNYVVKISTDINSYTDFKVTSANPLIADALEKDFDHANGTFVINGNSAGTTKFQVSILSTNGTWYTTSFSQTVTQYYPLSVAIGAQKIVKGDTQKIPVKVSDTPSANGVPDSYKHVDITDANLTFSSSDTNIFTVDADGNITGVNYGTANLYTVFSTGYGIKRTVTTKITVINANPLFEQLYLAYYVPPYVEPNNDKNIILRTSEKQVTAQDLADNHLTVTYSTSDSNVAFFKDPTKPVVTAAANPDYTKPFVVTATITDTEQNISRTLNLSLLNGVKSHWISQAVSIHKDDDWSGVINDDEMVLGLKDNLTIDSKVTKNPDYDTTNGGKYTVSFSSSNAKVAQVVSNGDDTASVHGLSEGSTMITVTLTDQWGLQQHTYLTVYVRSAVLANPGDPVPPQYMHVGDVFYVYTQVENEEANYLAKVTPADSKQSYLRLSGGDDSATSNQKIGSIKSVVRVTASLETPEVGTDLKVTYHNAEGEDQVSLITVHVLPNEQALPPKVADTDLTKVYVHYLDEQNNEIAPVSVVGTTNGSWNGGLQAMPIPGYTYLSYSATLSGGTLPDNLQTPVTIAFVYRKDTDTTPTDNYAFLKAYYLFEDGTKVPVTQNFFDVKQATTQPVQYNVSDARAQVAAAGNLVYNEESELTLVDPAGNTKPLAGATLSNTAQVQELDIPVKSANKTKKTDYVPVNVYVVDKSGKMTTLVEAMSNTVEQLEGFSDELIQSLGKQAILQGALGTKVISTTYNGFSQTNFYKYYIGGAVNIVLYLG
ncbi:hypothetical protein [Pseudolactococcus insecticola]|uniref:BIG2 domain-containing protein n=1 Tax=Pseudolactococcus insecticola TaxID=2709158 RepID=A0A6A0B7N7_9LACT|nr:hypothetical protein [Lactococcus insecticola]GFH41340.1 hypothetical protein Hs20B_17380 [Lactococcus insecticola]